MKQKNTILIFLTIFAQNCALRYNEIDNNFKPINPFDKDDLKERLTENQYETVVNHKGEDWQKGKYWDSFVYGKYYCIACDTVLFHSEHKIINGGFAAFNTSIGEIAEIGEYMNKLTVKFDIKCENCGAFLGYSFDNLEPITIQKQYTIASEALDFIEEQEPPKPEVKKKKWFGK